MIPYDNIEKNRTTLLHEHHFLMNDQVWIRALPEVVLEVAVPLW